MMQKIHILGMQFSTFVRSVQLYCEEKGLDYQVGFTEQIKVRSPEHYQLNPFGKMPILLHGDFTLSESTTICRYLDTVFTDSSLQPQQLQQRFFA